MPGVTAPAGENLLPVRQLRPHELRLRRPPPVQVTEAPAVAGGQRPGGRVGSQQLQRRSVGAGVPDGGPALDHIGVVPHPVVQRERELLYGVGERDAQFVALHRRLGVGPFGATDLGGTYRERGPDEPGTTLHRVLLAAVQPRFEAAEGQFRCGGEGLGGREGDARPPVQMQQFVPVREMQRIAAGRPGQQPGPTRVTSLDHVIPAFAQFRTSSSSDGRPDNARAGGIHRRSGRERPR